MTAFVGPNGGGKSTLMKLLVGLLTPGHGRIAIWENAKMGYVPQTVAFDKAFPLTVFELVLMGTLTGRLIPFYRYTPVQRGKAREALERLSLNGLEGRGLRQLSTGQLKRVLIARALASDADIWVLDEPDESLDRESSRALYRLLEDFKGEKTILIVSHKTDTILDIADAGVYVNRRAEYYDRPESLKHLLAEKGSL